MYMLSKCTIVRTIGRSAYSSGGAQQKGRGPKWRQDLKPHAIEVAGTVINVIKDYIPYP
jgi:hypothetical protein